MSTKVPADPLKDALAELAAIYGMRNPDFIDRLQSIVEYTAVQAIQQCVEQCAAVCEEKVLRPAGHEGAWEGYGRLPGHRTGPECAAAIRALLKEGKT